MPKTGNVAGQARWRIRKMNACLLLLFLGAAGCATGPKLIVESPLSSEEQQQAILKIAPKGTERAEVLRRLDKAGIQYEKSGPRVGNSMQGMSDSMYYCSIWNKSNGERWFLNVALLFDRSGRLYETRQRNSETGVADRSDLEPDTPATSRGSTSAGSSSPDTPRGARPRVPFAK